MQVLIIDDTQLNLTLMEHLVRRLPDCESISFLNPLLARNWCREQVPDLVIVDYMMPEMHGIEFTRQFRELPGCAEVPVLMVTANHETSLRHEALNQGITDFLNKPVDKTEFLARARNMLSLRESHKKLTDRAAWLAEEVRLATGKIVTREQETIFCLAKAAEYRDPETGSHILRMAHYSRQIAANLGFSLEQQELLLKTAPMHDIGKVGTPDLILLKPGRLTRDELAIMRQHTVIGYEVLSASSSPLMKVAAEIAHSHHEKYDGSGYPGGLKGEEIPVFWRIVAVADVFDALTSERPYKQAWSVEQASQFLKDGSGVHFDPSCVDAFLSGWKEVMEIRERFLDEGIPLPRRDIAEDF